MGKHRTSFLIAVILISVGIIQEKDNIDMPYMINTT